MPVQLKQGSLQHSSAQAVILFASYFLSIVFGLYTLKLSNFSNPYLTKGPSRGFASWTGIVHNWVSSLHEY